MITVTTEYTSSLFSFNFVSKQSIYYLSGEKRQRRLRRESNSKDILQLNFRGHYILMVTAIIKFKLMSKLLTIGSYHTHTVNWELCRYMNTKTLIKRLCLVDSPTATRL